MILRFATDLPVPFTNNEAEHSIRPVKVQQKTSAGCWRTQAGLTGIPLVHSYPNTTHKWGIDNFRHSNSFSPPVRGCPYPHPS